MVRFRILAVCAAALVLAGCGSTDTHKQSSHPSPSPSTVTKDDLYAAGCPLLDGALGSWTLSRKVTAEGIKKLRDNADLSAEHKQWLNDAIDLLNKKKPDEAPGTIRHRLSKACSDHGHPLSNLD